MKSSFLPPSDSAKRNRNALLHYIKDFGPVSRTDIFEQMPVSRASVTLIIRQLQSANLILELGAGESTGGRKPLYLAFNHKAKYIYAFDWLSQSLFLLDLGGNILFEKKRRIPI